MAKKKYYAVRKGTTIGIFETWEECQAATTGYSNAEYKSFLSIEEAQKYLRQDTEDINNLCEITESMDILPTKVIAYVDGSYDDSLKRYSFGCVLLTASGVPIKERGSEENPTSLMLRNVAGEMIGAMYAVRWAMLNGYSEIELRYDYEGIEKWVTGEWKAKNELTQKYAVAMKQWSESIQLSFLKVKAHSNDKYNDMADALAKSALTEVKGIPKIKR